MVEWHMSQPPMTLADALAHDIRTAFRSLQRDAAAAICGGSTAKNLVPRS